MKLLGEHCAFPLCAVIRGAGLCATVEGGDGGCDPEAERGGGEHEREGEFADYNPRGRCLAMRV